ncbi:hypothetical protein L4D77_00085 [Photobacterium frigidiphilum]|uniref:hypothetical protein n=1 Tax=Photobacterium frigidiphilum TaxID=264736 RepID=UPI003D13EB0E
MANLKRLISGQNISFDTHQAGDGQNVNWRNVHLEKSVHGERGKAKFPLLSNELPSNKGMNQKVYARVTKEVKRELKRNGQLVDDLVDTVADVIKRFSQGTATVSDGLIAAEKLAGYFDLDNKIISSLPNEFKDPKDMTFSTIHTPNDGDGYIEIKQSSERVDVRKASDETLREHQMKGQLRR